MEINERGDRIILLLVILCDFVIANLALLGIFLTIGENAKQFLEIEPSILYLVTNVALAAAEMIYTPIVIQRGIRFGAISARVFRISVVQCILMLVTLYNFCNANLYKLVAGYFALTFCVILLSRIGELGVLSYIRGRKRNTRNVIFIGDDPAITKIYRELSTDPTIGYVVVGYYADDIDKSINIPHLGSMADLDKIISGEQVQCRRTDEVFCCLSHSEYKRIFSIIKYCDLNTIRFYYVPRSFGDTLLRLKPEIFGGTTIFTNYTEPLAKLSNRFIKRAFDIVISGIACLVILVLLPFIALCIKIQSPEGPIFFRQKRTGLNGQTFNCLKFRSMHVNSQADTLQATENDSRKFAFGNLMRKTNIDELPQFFNVFLGDMSIVGPRPHMLMHTEVYSKLIGNYMVRHFCKPGITGWAQVTGFRGETKELWQMEERVKRDIWYLEHWSLWLDIKIMFMTAKSFFVHDKHAY